MADQFNLLDVSQVSSNKINTYFVTIPIGVDTQILNANPNRIRALVQARVGGTDYQLKDGQGGGSFLSIILQAQTNALYPNIVTLNTKAEVWVTQGIIANGVIGVIEFLNE